MFTLPIIQMGARLYLPTTGRFLQVDPVEGGTLNAYLYVSDPVNMEDYSGEWGKLIDIVQKALPVAQKAAQKSTNWLSRGWNRVFGSPIVQKSASGPTGPPMNVVSAQSSRVTVVVGSRAAPLMDRTVVKVLGNNPAVIGDRLYRSHALNQMQNSGIYPSVVENTIKWGQRLQSSSPTTTKLYEPVNDITVILNKGGDVVTTWYGR